MGCFFHFYKYLTKMVGQTEKLSPEERKQERILGTDPKTGRKVSVRHGPFGPHAMIGSKDDPKEVGKPKSASLKKGQDITTITLDEALDLFVLPRLLGETPDGDLVALAGLKNTITCLLYTSTTQRDS